MSKGCFWGDTGVLKGCGRGVTGLLKVCLKGVLQGCHSGGTGVEQTVTLGLQGDYRVTRVLHVGYYRVSQEYQRGVRGV